MFTKKNSQDVYRELDNYDFSVVAYTDKQKKYLQKFKKKRE